MHSIRPPDGGGVPLDESRRICGLGIANLFERERDVKAYFGSVLSKLEDMTQKNKYDHIPEHLKPHIQFMKEVLVQLHAVKDSWRDKVAHVDTRIIPSETFTPGLAMGAHNATLLLMEKLVNGLPARNSDDDK